MLRAVKDKLWNGLGFFGCFEQNDCFFFLFSSFFHFIIVVYVVAKHLLNAFELVFQHNDVSVKRQWNKTE